MDHYQDTETGMIHAFDVGTDVTALMASNKNLPKTLSKNIKIKPSEEYVWLDHDWIERKNAPRNYKAPVSSLPIYSPAWIAFLKPYTLIPSSDGFVPQATIDEVNLQTYNNQKLSEVIAKFPYFKNNNQLSILLTHDGAIAIPREFPTEMDNVQGAEDVNRIFCALLIGGIHVEVIGLQDLCSGTIYEKNEIFCHNSNLHSRIRHKWASDTEVINLVHARQLEITDLQEALSTGEKAINLVENLTPFFLLNGYTALIYGNSRDALSSLWIVVEQLTSIIWETKFLSDTNLHPKGMKARTESLKTDHRTWTTAVKHEFFWQRKWLNQESYSALSAARKARNELVHSGNQPSLIAVTNLWSPLCDLFELASSLKDLPMRKLIYSEVAMTAKHKKQAPKIDFSDWTDLQAKFS